MPSPLKGKPKSAGVEKSVRIQLAKDIEQLGGPLEFEKKEGIVALLRREDRQEIYGPFVQKSPTQKKLFNLLHAWKQYSSKEEWLSKVYIPLVIQANDSDLGQEPQSVSPNHQPPAREPTKQIPSANKPRTSPAQPPSTATNQKSFENMNRLGKQILVPLPKGLYLVAVWAECNLSNIELSISSDGYSVIKRTKKPDPSDASELLAHYAWANDPDNVVISSLDDALEEIRRDDPEQWVEAELVTLQKEVIRVFVDHRGRPLGDNASSVGQRTDEDGRKIITFFLKTVDAHRTKPAKVKFGGGPSGMNVSSDDSSNSMFAEETVEDVRAEMDDMRRQFEEMMSVQQRNLQEQNQTMQQQMQQMMGFMQQISQQNQQPQQQNQPIPDGHASAGQY